MAVYSVVETKFRVHRLGMDIHGDDFFRAIIAQIERNVLSLAAEMRKA